MRRAAKRTVAVAAGAMLLALPWAGEAAADVAQVSVVSPGGSERTLSLDALAGSEDVVDHPYALRSASGETTQPVSGFSLAALLDAAGADPYGFSYLEVQRPAGGAVLLSRDQALAGPEGPPVVYPTAGGTGFLRPSAGPEDLNATDSFEAPQGISIVLRKGTHLRVRASASSKRTRPGAPVEFSAVVEQAGAGEQLEYSWYFDDGASATGAEATHTFTKPGSYDVVVGVTSDGNETGASAIVTIQVGPPVGGPDRKGGGKNDDASAPDHGAATGPSSGTGNGFVAPVTGVAASRVGCAPQDTQHGRRPCVRRSTPDPATPSETKRESDPGTQVVGELVSATAELPEPASKQAAARSGQLQGDGGGGGIPGVALGLLGAFGLLGLGALVEARSLLP